MDTHARVFANTNKFDVIPPLEFQTDTVDSMSPPHAAEYVSAQHALAQDSATLQLIDQDMKECQVRIARAHAHMRLLERQRDAIQRRVTVHRARLSPTRSIPDQVLQEIFQHCLPDTPYVVPDARCAPLVLTHVCRRWRAVVQGTSELWSSIALRDNGVWNYELEVEMVKLWLDRSCTRPIRMSITCSPCTNFGLNGNASCSDIFQLAIAHSTQLKDLYLNVNEMYLRHFMERVSLSELRDMTISLHSTHRINEPLEPNITPFMSAPNLRRIQFKGNGTSSNLIPRTVFPQITHLSFDCNMTLDLALLFQDFAHLQHLALTLSPLRDALRFRLPPQGDHRLSAPSLLSLEIRLDKDMLDFGDPEKLETLLDQLELPALRTLSVAAPLRPQFDARTGGVEACWENHVEWVRSPSVVSLLSRSRYTRPQFWCVDLAERGGSDRRLGGVQIILPVTDSEDSA